MPKLKKKKRSKSTDNEIVIRKNGAKVKHPTSKTCWESIAGFEGYYEVSNTGKVRACERDITYESGKVCHLKSHLVIPSADKDGYLLVHLYKGNKPYTFKIHKLVATYFIKNPDHLSEVNHKDEDKTNNNVTNLEWCTHEYNMQYGTRKERQSATATQFLFQRFDLKGNYIDTLANQDLERLGFKQSVIWRATIGKCNTSSGFRWHRISIKDAEKAHNPKMRSDGSVVNQATSSTAWKQFEREVASEFGTKRVPLSGSNSGHNTNSDSLHPELYIECKVRQNVWLHTLYNDTESKAKVEGKIPLVAIKQKGQKGYLLAFKPEYLEKITEIHKKYLDNKK